MQPGFLQAPGAAWSAFEPYSSFRVPSCPAFFGSTGCAQHPKAVPQWEPSTPWSELVLSTTPLGLTLMSLYLVTDTLLHE